MTTEPDGTATCPACGAPLGDPDGCDACDWKAPYAAAPATIVCAPLVDGDVRSIAAVGERLPGPGAPAWRACGESMNVCGDAGKPRLMAADEPCPVCGDPTLAVLGFLTREPCRPAQSYDAADDSFSVGGEGVPADAAHDVCLPILDTGDGRMRYPRCPDCGGAVAWAEAGGVSGSRECIGEAPDLWESRRWRRALAEAAAEGEPAPELPGAPGCGSTFADSAYHAASRSHRCDIHPEGIQPEDGR